MTRKQTASRDERREEASERLAEALQPMLDGGVSFTELSVERIVKEAGISRTTFYVYFEDKGDLLVSIAEGVMEELNETARGWWQRPAADLDRDEVGSTIRSVIAVYAQNSGVMQAVAEVASYDERVRVNFGRLIAVTRRGLRDHLSAGLSGGAIRPEIDPERTSAWLVWMVERGFYQLVRPAAGDEAELDLLADSLSTVVWNTLYENAPGRGER